MNRWAADDGHVARTARAGARVHPRRRIEMDQTDGGEVFGARARTNARPGRGAGALIRLTTIAGGTKRVASLTICARALARNAKTTEQCSWGETPALSAPSIPVPAARWCTAGGPRFETIPTSIASPCSAHSTCLTLASCRKAENCANPTAAISAAANSLATTAPLRGRSGLSLSVRASMLRRNMSHASVTSKSNVGSFQ